MPLSPRFLVPAIVNSTNLNGTAAVLLSLGLGSVPGACLFAAAVTIGSINKYHSLERQSRGADGATHRLRAALEHPTLTAVILMIAAAVNCLDAAWRFAAGPDDMRVYYAMATLAWGFGVLGDNALRMNDQSNFARAFDHHYRDGFFGLIAVAARNPAFYFLFCSIFMGAATIMRSGLTVGILEIYIQCLLIVLSAAGILYCLYRTHTVLSAGRSTDDINDGIINYINAAGCVAVGVLALLTGNHYVLIAQVLFTFSNIKALFETRSALKKETAADALP